jgi:hypothetical protein
LRPARALAVGVTLAVALAAPAPVRGAARREPLRFANLAWEARPEAIARAMTAAGFASVAAETGEASAWRGEAYGAGVRAVPQLDRAGRLIAVDLRFGSSRSAPLDRYDALVARLRRCFGPWAYRIPAGRPVRQEHLGRYGVTRTFGPRTAATIWTDGAGAAALAQLDGDGVLWLRFESPRWDEAGGGDDPSP